MATSVPLTTCIIGKSWPPEQWELFAKKKSCAHSKARRGRSVSMSASPAPSVAETSVGRPSVPPASPPPSRDQVVMGGQTSVGVSVSCLGSAPSGSVTMATGYISDDVVAAFPDPPPTSGGEGGEEKLAPPSPARVPAVFSRLGGERSVWILLAPPTLALPALPLRRESGDGSGAVSVRVLPRFPLGIAPVPVLESAERERFAVSPAFQRVT